MTRMMPRSTTFAYLRLWALPHALEYERATRFGNFAVARFITLRCYFDGRLSQRTIVTLTTDHISTLKRAEGNGSLATVRLTSGAEYGLETEEFKRLAAVIPPQP